MWESAWTDRWTLKLGDKGLAVALWQKFLIDHSLLQHPRLDFDDKYSINGFVGYFENLTLSATKKYQKSKGLTEDGIVGFDTYSRASKEGFDGISVEMAITFGLARMFLAPNQGSKLEVVLSSKGDRVFTGIDIPTLAIPISENRKFTANEALREFKSTFIG